MRRLLLVLVAVAAAVAAQVSSFPPAGGSASPVISATGKGWYAPFGIIFANTGATLGSANDTHFNQFIIRDETKISYIVAAIKTAAASAGIRLGIYSANTDGTCNAQLAYTALGSAATATTSQGTVQKLAITNAGGVSASSVTLAPGIYYQAYSMDSTTSAILASDLTLAYLFANPSGEVVRVGKGSVSTGGATLTLPATCGALSVTGRGAAATVFLP